MFDQEYSGVYSPDSIKKAIMRSYAYMALGLLITAVVAYGLYASGLLLVILNRMPFLVYGSLIIQLILCFSFSAAMRSSSSTSIKVMFIIYAITMGFSMSSLGYAYGAGTIGIAFGVSALYFISLAVIGTTTKRDLTSIGSICFVGLIVLVITQLFMMLFGISSDVRLYSIIGLLLFTGITAWDVQRMNSLLVMSDGNMIEQEKIAIFMALELYLDFINIFLYILELIGIGSSKD